MARGDLCENLLCLLAFGIGFVVAIPLALTRTSFGGKCLLFGEADLLTRTFSGGKAIYCQYGIYSSSTNVVLAAFLVFFRWCCVVKTMQTRTIHFMLFSSILSAMGWINSVVCAVFVVLGFDHWCKTITRNSLASSCQEAEQLDWSIFTPQTIDGSKFYTLLTMVQITSCMSAVVWFLISVLSGKHLRNWFLDVRATELYIQDLAFQGTADSQNPSPVSGVNANQPPLQQVQFVESHPNNYIVSQENPMQVKRMIYM